MLMNHDCSLFQSHSFSLYFCISFFSKTGTDGHESAAVPKQEAGWENWSEETCGGGASQADWAAGEQTADWRCRPHDC